MRLVDLAEVVIPETIAVEAVEEVGAGEMIVETVEGIAISTLEIVGITHIGTSVAGSETAETGETATATVFEDDAHHHVEDRL